jgi:hypothetical protein
VGAPDTGAPTIAQKNINSSQGAKFLSSPPIYAPARVLDAELFAGAWKPAISTDGVAIEIARLRARALVSP